MTPPPANGRPRRRPRAAGTAAALLCSVLLAGCGGSPSKAGAGAGDGSTTTPARAAVPLPADRPQRPACALVTQAEVEAALGAKVAAGKETSAEARSLCSFALASAGDQAVIVAATSSSGVPAAFTEARGKAESPQPLTAGDEAFITPGQAVVRKGTTMVAILLAVRQPAAQLTSAATKLVQAVSSHL